MKVALFLLALATGATAFAPSSMHSRALRKATVPNMAFDMEASIQETKVREGAKTQMRDAMQTKAAFVGAPSWGREDVAIPWPQRRGGDADARGWRSPDGGGGGGTRRTGAAAEGLSNSSEPRGQAAPSPSSVAAWRSSCRRGAAPGRRHGTAPRSGERGSCGCSCPSKSWLPTTTTGFSSSLPPTHRRPGLSTSRPSRNAPIRRRATPPIAPHPASPRLTPLLPTRPSHSRTCASSTSRSRPCSRSSSPLRTTRTRSSPTP